VGYVWTCFSLKLPNISFRWSPTYLFVSFVTWAFGVISKRALPHLSAWRSPPVFSFKKLALTFQPVIHLQLMFAYDVMKVSNFILLHHLLKRLFFPYLIALASLSKNQLTTNVRVYFWSLSCFPLAYTSVILPVTNGLDYWNFAESLEIRKCENFSYICWFSCLSSKTLSCLSGIFWNGRFFTHKQENEMFDH
jgi:hypothetical protein